MTSRLQALGNEVNLNDPSLDSPRLVTERRAEPRNVLEILHTLSRGRKFSMFKFDFDFDENDSGRSAVISGNLGPSTSETDPTVLEPFCEIPLSNLVCSTSIPRGFSYL